MKQTHLIEAKSGEPPRLEPQPVRLTYTVEEAGGLLGIGHSLVYEREHCQVSAGSAHVTLSQRLPSMLGSKVVRQRDRVAYG